MNNFKLSQQTFVLCNVCDKELLAKEITERGGTYYNYAQAASSEKSQVTYVMDDFEQPLFTELCKRGAHIIGASPYRIPL